jgi:tRNA(Ile2) C34 agmatinyltransferase TiaS
MIFVGIDDTDTIDTPGTNQLARRIADRVARRFDCVAILRHQLFFDPRVPYTSHNGSASLRFVARASASIAELIDETLHEMQAWFIDGSDPGLCVAREVPDAVVDWGRRCQFEVVEQSEARRLAAANGIHLEGLGGTEGGVIGALAAVGLAATGEDGRYIRIGTSADDLSGLQEVETLQSRGVEVRRQETMESLTAGVVDIGKRLRPNCRGGRPVLYVSRPSEGVAVWQAVRVP